MKHSIILVWLLCISAVHAQVPASTTIEVNNVRATIRADGGLFTNGQEGVFVPLQPGLAEKTLLRHSGIWMIGLDPAGNLKGAVSMNGQTDFQAGLSPSLPDDWNKIWEVSCTDINQHLADLQDNGIVDNPNTNLYSFPGRGNPFFEQYNQFNLPPGQVMAGFFDNTANNFYDPQEGDYPAIDIRNCPLGQSPEYQNWFVFNDNLLHPSGLGPTQSIEVHTQVFAYKTMDSSPFNNAIFVRYKLINRSPQPLDSCFIGIYADFDIGNPGDDFLGVIPNRSILYGYNGDPNDEGGFEENIPVMALDLMRGPADMDGVELGLSHAMVLETPNNLLPNEFYRLLTGHFADGTPAPNGGLMYPSNPNDPSGDSEVTAGSTPGQRAGLASYGPFRLIPGAVNELIVAYYYVNTPGATPLENVQALYSQPDVLQNAFDNCFLNFEKACDLTLNAPEAAAFNGLSIYPNPTSTFFNLESKVKPFSRIQIFDLLGRQMRQFELENPVHEFVVSSKDLPLGTYLVRVENRVLPLVIQR